MFLTPERHEDVRWYHSFIRAIFGLFFLCAGVVILIGWPAGIWIGWWFWVWVLIVSIITHFTDTYMQLPLPPE